MNSKHKPVAVMVGATSKWQSDGRNTRLAHGKELDDSHLPVGVRWGVGGTIAQKFAQEGFFTQDKSSWTHEHQQTPFPTKPGF